MSDEVLKQAIEAAGIGGTATVSAQSSGQQQTIGALPPAAGTTTATTEKPKPTLPASVVDPAGSLMDLTDLITVMAVRAFAKTKGVEWRPEYAGQCKLTKEERNQLAPFADKAAPYLLEILRHSDKICAIAYAGLYALFLSDRFSAVKKIKVAQDEKKKLEAAKKPKKK